MLFVFVLAVIASPVGTSICGQGQYACDNGYCIGSSSVCNGEQECVDGSDETESACNTTICSRWEFACDGRKCIHSTWVCDGEQDCADGSDETETVCDSSFCVEHTCDNGQCILSWTVCDEEWDCDDGSDETETLCNTRNCGHAEYACNTIGQCINSEWVCDGKEDCADGTDEAACSHKCERWEHSCDDGQCIFSWSVCDGELDCLDGSDEVESGCNTRICAEGQFACNSGQCIDHTWLCNRYLDCTDGSDETDTACDNKICGGSEHVCDNGQCILRWYLCDDDWDCDDGSDETEKVCGTTTVWNHGITEVSTITPGPCGQWEHTCDYGECIFTWYVCDGELDCVDGSDETETACNTCIEGEHPCDDGQCIYVWRLCDGSSDCNDGSDETETACDPSSCTEHSCGDGQCIPTWWVCDGASDCDNGGDEVAYLCKLVCSKCGLLTCNLSLDTTVCERIDIPCDNDGLCVATSWVCDGEEDCLDGSDETDHACGITSITTHPGTTVATITPGDTETCGEWFHSCGGGKCIHSSWVCDRERDCDDGSDEAVALCGTTTVTTQGTTEAATNTSGSSGTEPCDEGWNACDDGNCIAGIWICDGEWDCHDGSDETESFCNTRICGQAEYACGGGGGQCISSSWVCDGEFDCVDDSDESATVCSTRLCQAWEYPCDNGQCIDILFVCDGLIHNCDDGSDETETACNYIVPDEPCSPERHDCGGGQCIPRDWVCDGVTVCTNRSEESEEICAGRVCLPEEYRCEGGRCIPRNWTCNDYMDCQDGSDEGENLCFKCSPSSTNIPSFKICDGFPDCPSGEDESTDMCSFHCNLTPGIHLAVLNKSSTFHGDVRQCLVWCWETDFCVFVKTSTQTCVLLSSWAYHDLNDFYELDTYRDNELIKMINFCDLGCHDDYCYHLEDGLSNQGCSQGSVANRTSLDQLKCLQIPRLLTEKDVKIGINMVQGTSYDMTIRFVLAGLRIEYEEIGNATHTRPDVYMCKRPATNTDKHYPDRNNMILQTAWKCENGDIMNVNARCDGKTDCLNAEDESSCPWKDRGHITEHFQCKNGDYVPYSVYCDFIQDCKDGSDEDCIFPECSYDEIRCDNGQCVDYKALCNGQQECFDASDESQRFCESVPSWWQSKLLKSTSERENMTDAACDGFNGLDQFRCQINNESAFLARSNVCDGKVDCSLANDERLCTVEQCPATCICNIFEVRCKNLDNIETNNVSVNTRYLDISGSKGADDILFDLLDLPLEYLARLDTSRTNINLKARANVSFAKMPNLIELNLSQNNIIDLQPLLNLSKAKYLDLSQNKIKCLNLDIFSDCQKLEFLILSANLIENINGTTDNGLTMLHTLDISYNRLFNLNQLKNFQFQNMTNLQVMLLNNNEINDLGRYVFGGEIKIMSLLNISHNEIVNVDPGAFVGIEIVHVLDLSFNKLSKIKFEMFRGIAIVNSIDLSQNEISSIEENTFSELKEFSGKLLLNNNRLKELTQGVFGSIANLRELSLSNNEIVEVEDNTFKGFHELKTLDISDNNIEIFSRKIFNGPRELEVLKTDNYKFCCLKPRSVTFTNCDPKADEFSSCENLMRNVFASHMMCVLAVCAIGGNVATFVYRTTKERKKMKQGFGIFVTNLAVSDFIMGVYLVIIAAVDVYYQGSYISNEETWRNSTLCTFAGVISTLSSEASVFFICLITIDRLFVIKWPLGKLRFGTKSAFFASLIFWLLAVVIAICPVLYTDYFGDRFYSTNGVCIALPLTGIRPQGWEYSLAVFVFFNFLTFLLISFGQIMIFVEFQCQRKVITSLSSRRKADLAVARNLLLVVLTDFLCWVPVGVMGVMALAGYSISGDVYVWASVFILPVNAALNPVLYTLSAIIKKEKFAPRQDEQRQLISMNMKNWKTFCRRSAMFYLDSTQEAVNVLIRRRCLKPVEAALIFTELTIQLAKIHEVGLCQGKLNLDMINLAMLNNQIQCIKVDLLPKMLTKEDDIRDDIYELGRIGRMLVNQAEKTINQLGIRLK